MTDLERFAAALLVQWRADGGADGGPIAIGVLLDTVFPYRTARRALGIDVSEDYEAMVLRLLAEEDQLVRTEPLDAAEMAKATIDSKLPDLDVLQLLRAATVTLSARTIARIDGVLPMPAPKEGPRWAGDSIDATTEPAPGGGRPPADSDAKMPDGDTSRDVIPLPVVAEPLPKPVQSADAPAEFLTTVSFTPPVEDRCWSCRETLPADRAVKYCPFCGADQRRPQCAACGAPVERRWKHCAECGASLGSG